MSEEYHFVSSRRTFERARLLNEERATPVLVQGGKEYRAISRRVYGWGAFLYLYGITRWRWARRLVGGAWLREGDGAWLAVLPDIYPLPADLPGAVEYERWGIAPLAALPGRSAYR